MLHLKCPAFLRRTNLTLSVRHNLTKPINIEILTRNFLPFLLIAFTVLFSCNENKSVISETENEEQAIKTYVIKNVNIIPMTENNKVIKNATVVIHNKKVLSINDTIPSDAKAIDGTGKWLIPGLIDMHVHTRTNYFERRGKPTKGSTHFKDTQHMTTPYVANGITTVFNLNATFQHFAQRDEIASGKVIGPRMALAGLIDGTKRGYNGQEVDNPNDGRQAVRSAKGLGYNFIKVYSFLNKETFKAIVDEANKQGIKVVGHIPDAFRGVIEEAFVPHFGLVAHAEEYGKQSKNKTKEDAEYYAQLAKQNNTWLTSSLISMIWIDKQLKSLDYVKNDPNLKYAPFFLQDRWTNPKTNHYYKRTSPEFIAHVESLIDFQKKLIKAFNDAGVPIVAGTDAGGMPGLSMGFSLHDELELMVEYSMTTEETLIAATRLPAEWLGIDSEVGTVEIGKLADLILLDANPLDDIKNSRSINGVFVNGTWVDANKIKSLLLELEEHNKAERKKERKKGI